MYELDHSVTVHCMFPLYVCLPCYHKIVRNTVCTSLTTATTAPGSNGGIVMPVEATGGS
jgi:hypothetical protein